MNIAAMSKDEIVARSKFRCKHGHDGLSHKNCYSKDKGIVERVAYLDTEFYVGKNSWGKLAGDWGFILCWVIGDGNGHYVHDVIKPKEIFTTQDKRIVKSCIEELSKYDRVVHHYGDRCDIPLLRTRALTHDLAFPTYGGLYTTDLWRIAKEKLCLSSNSQKSISKLLFGETEKTEVVAETWMKAIRGDKKSLVEILDHCVHDVHDLERNARKLTQFIKKTNKSI